MQMQLMTYLSTDDFEDADSLTPEEQAMAPHAMPPQAERAYAAHSLHVFNAANDDLDLDLGETREWIIY
ncbi:MAG: hypothetical protein FJY56_11790 [Betaproteobacteria bacterium]|nr:hypothetical protein [Betaproteobacteria bacterium]